MRSWASGLPTSTHLRSSASPVRKSAVEALVALQREDGGWAQTSILTSDTYATGQSLYALHLAGIPATHPAYKRGVDYLLKTQRANGSRYVTTRSHPVQPLIDTDHPYVHHQWISASAGAALQASFLSSSAAA